MNIAQVIYPICALVTAFAVAAGVAKIKRVLKRMVCSDKPVK